MRNGLALASILLLACATALAAEPDADTPRAAVEHFLTAERTRDWTAVPRYLDLSAIPAEQRERDSRELARRLATVLNQRLASALETLSDQPEGDRTDGLPAPLERVGVVRTRSGPVDVLLRRSASGRWTFTAHTLAAVPQMYDATPSGVLDGLLPRVFFDARALDVALWQWLGLLCLVVLAWGASWAATALGMRLALPLARRAGSPIDERLLAALVAPARLGVALGVFAVGVLVLALTPPARDVFSNVERAAAILVIAWSLLRVIDVFAALTAERLAVRGQASAVSVVPLGSKAAKVVVIAFAAIATLQNVGVNVTGLLAGLGIGGLAVALAAQKTVENLFGGVTLVLDQPVRVGDFCRFGDRVGTVEEIGLRSTRVRTLDRTVVAIPNAQFSALELENFSKRDRIWLQPTLRLRYETTPDQLRYVLVEIRRLLYAHPKVDPDPARIRFVGFGPHSLDCEIFAYVLTADYGEFLAVREDILLRIMDVVAASGTSLAIPSQTMYIGADAGLHDARSRDAEARVRTWRADGALGIPEFSPDEIDRLRATLDYPPRPRGAELG